MHLAEWKTSRGPWFFIFQYFFVDTISNFFQIAKISCNYMRTLCRILWKSKVSAHDLVDCKLKFKEQNDKFQGKHNANYQRWHLMMLQSKPADISPAQQHSTLFVIHCMLHNKGWQEGCSCISKMLSQVLAAEELWTCTTLSLHIPLVMNGRNTSQSLMQDLDH